jgi:Uma2 family endonuclease
MEPKPSPPPRPPGQEALAALPEQVVGEIIDGELFVSPRPSPRHALAASRLTIELGGPFDRGRGGPGGWWILDEPELHLGSNVLVPDLAGWRRERMPRLPDTAWFELAPDWICEVLSPSTGIIDRTRKLKHYARATVSWIWLVDPATRTVEVLHLDGEDWMLAGNFGGDEKARIAPFDAVELEVGALWEAALPPAPRAQEPDPQDVAALSPR